MTEQTGFPEPGPELDLGLPPQPLRITRFRPRWTVEAVCLTADADLEAIAKWCDGTVRPYELGRAVRVWTENGSMFATDGDWIVKGASRLPRVYEVNQATLFAELYEQVTE